MISLYAEAHQLIMKIKKLPKKFEKTLDKDQKNKTTQIIKLFAELEKKHKKVIPLKELYEECKKRNIPEKKMKKVIRALKWANIINEPKKGYIKRGKK